jgi:hypothetical protein
MEEKKDPKQLNGDEQSNPEQLKENAKQRAERLKEENEVVITILSRLKNHSKEKILYEYTKDISTTGVKIQGNILLPISTILQMDLMLKNLNQKVTAFGKVRWHKVLIDGQSYEAGVEFIDTSSDAIKKLQEYVASKQKFTSLNPVGVPFWIFAKFNNNKPKDKP